MPASPELIAQATSTLYTAVLSDTLDSLGYRQQAMAGSVRPLDDSLTLFGRARTGLFRDVYHVEPDTNPYELEIKLIDDLQEGEIAVMACGASGRIAPWGELLSTASRMRGAAGCVTDGLVRDVRQIRKMEFPVFAGGIAPLDSRGRGMLVAIDEPAECGGVLVTPGDLVFGDVDGLVVIPQSIETEALEQAIAKVTGQNETRDCLLQGMLLAQVYEKYGIL